MSAHSVCLKSVSLGIVPCSVSTFCPARGPKAAIIALTHDPKLDDLALMEALTSPAFYIGAIGSRVNQAQRKQRLREHFGLSDAQLARLHGPVGLKNGARTPPEIAVSILAELTSVRCGYRVPEPVPVKAQAAVEAGCRVA